MQKLGITFYCCSVAVAVQLLSHDLLFETPWTVAHPALLSMGFPRLEYWSGLPFPSPGDLPNSGIIFILFLITIIPLESLSSSVNLGRIWEEIGKDQVNNANNYIVSIIGP